jgi:hypothetical protein
MTSTQPCIHGVRHRKCPDCEVERLTHERDQCDDAATTLFDENERLRHELDNERSAMRNVQECAESYRREVKAWRKGFPDWVFRQGEIWDRDDIPADETAAPHCCHEWLVIAGELDGAGEHYTDECKKCKVTRVRDIPPV